MSKAKLPGRDKRISGIAAAVGLIAVLGPAPALAEFGSPQTVSASASFEPQVAADPQGNAVAVWRRGSAVQAAFRPANGSFGAPQTVSDDPGSTSANPRVAIDSEGNAVAVWTRSTSATTPCVPPRFNCVSGTLITTAVEAAFRPRDGSFGPVQRIATGEYFRVDDDVSGLGNDSGRLLSSARVAIGPEGDAIAVWVVSDHDEGVEQHIDAAFRPAGATFGPAQAISTSTSASYSEPDIAVGSQATAVAVWERRGGTDSRIEAAFSPGGGVFGTAQTISDTFSALPDVAVDPAGGAVAVWQRSDGIGTGDSRIEAAFRPAGGSFGDVQTVSDPGGSFPRVAVDAQGGAVAVWGRFDGTNFRIEAALRPAGDSFGTPQTISDPGQNAGSAQVAVDPDGVAVAIWDGSGHIQAAFRPAGGSFGDVQTVSDPGGYAPQVAVDAEGGAVAVWERFVDSESRIETAFHPIPFEGYARPRAATPVTIRLVPAFESCTEPNGSHGAPLTAASCNPPTLSSDHLTVGTPDANGKASRFAGHILLKVVGEHPVDPLNGDQADVEITTSLTDVRNKGDLSDYTGELRAVLGLRITDRYNGPSLDRPSTVTDIPFSFAVPCSETSGPEGGTCNLTTTVDAVMAEVAREGKRAIWELSQVQVYDGGPDGDADTADNTLFAVEGLFAP